MAKIFIAIGLCVLFFVPFITVSNEVVVEKQVSEEYTTIEPYIVQEEIKEPYGSVGENVYWKEGSVDKFGNYVQGHFVTEQRYATRVRTVTKDVTKYREVTKTRLVYRPVIETQTRRVSILRYLLR